MRHHLIRLLVLTLMFTIPLSATPVNAAVPESSEPVLLDDLYRASLDSIPVVTRGGLVVWLARTDDTANGSWFDAEIRAARLPDFAPFVVATGLRDSDGDHALLATDGQVVVWVDPYERHTIFGVRLDTSEQFVIAQLEPSPDNWSPSVGSLAVAGDLVAWTTYDAETSRVQARNISSMDPVVTLDQAPTVESGIPELGRVAVDGSWLVWGRRANNVTWAKVIARNIDTGDELTVDNPGGGLLAVNPVRDGVLALPVNQGYKNVDAPDIGLIDIQMIDLESRDITTITIQYKEQVEGPYPSANVFHGFDGRYLYQAFQLSIPTSSPGLQQIVAYDTRSGASFPIGRDIFRRFVAADGSLAWEVTGGKGSLIYATSLANRLPTAREPEIQQPGMDSIWFPETEHALQGVFKSYWETNGSLPVFGYPLTGEFSERSVDTGNTYTVQFTERQRFEWHPANAGTPYEVLLGRLGAELLTLQGRDWTTFPKADPTSPHYFGDSGHAIAPEFWDFWSGHGLEFGDPEVTFRESLALFGYPLSPAMMETNADGHTVLTQYFERAVFEHHPQNPAPYDVLLRRAGTEMLLTLGWSEIEGVR